MTRSLHIVGNVQLDVLAGPVDRLPRPGGDDVIDHISVRPAGAAGNVSLALAALGVEHRLFGAVGDDQAGRWVADELRKLGLARDLHVVAGRETGISIALEAPGRERAFITAHGVLTDYGVESLPEDAIAADFVLLTGYFSLPAFRGRGTQQLLRRARQRRSIRRLGHRLGSRGLERFGSRGGTGPATPHRPVPAERAGGTHADRGSRPRRRPSSSSPNDAAAGSS